MRLQSAPAATVRLSLLFALWLATLPASEAADSRAELMFDATSAVKMHNRSALLRCVNFAGADDETIRSTLQILDTILAWPSAGTKESERAGRGPVEIRENGRARRINGEWICQIHFIAQSPVAGTSEYVFPAGVADGKYLILLAVPEADTNR